MLTRRDKYPVSMYDAFLLVILLANLINSDIRSWWWFTLMIFWQRIYLILQDIIDDYKISQRSKEIEKELQEESND